MNAMTDDNTSTAGETIEVGPQGGCPVCGERTASRDVDHLWWSYCIAHRLKWPTSCDLRDYHDPEVEAAVSRANEHFLADFEEVRGLPLGQWPRDPQARRQALTDYDPPKGWPIVDMPNYGRGSKDGQALSVLINSPSLTPRVKAAIRRFDQLATIEWCLADPMFEEFGVEPKDPTRQVEHYRRKRNFTVDFAERLDTARREFSEGAEAALNELAEADLSDRERWRIRDVRQAFDSFARHATLARKAMQAAIDQCLGAAASADEGKRVELDREASEFAYDFARRLRRERDALGGAIVSTLTIASALAEPMDITVKAEEPLDERIPF